MSSASPLRCLAVMLGILAMLPFAHAENAPAVNALRVAKIATDYLATHGKDAPYIVSIALESDAFIGGTTTWVVRFSRPVLADGNKEIGMRVKLDGTVSYIIENKPGSKKRKAPANS